LLAAYALSMLAAEALRPSLPYFSTADAAVKNATDARGSAERAALIGLMRGDLWADDAFAQSATLLGDISNHKGIGIYAPSSSARAAAERTVSLSPHESRTWLILAALALHSNAPDDLMRALKMSYYTGPNDDALIGFRMLAATRSTAISDQEVQELARADFRNVLLHKTELKPSITTAFLTASGPGKDFIVAVLRDLDPAFLASLEASQ
jgi:hypothetical protein